MGIFKNIFKRKIPVLDIGNISDIPWKGHTNNLSMNPVSPASLAPNQTYQSSSGGGGGAWTGPAITPPLHQYAQNNHMTGPIGPTGATYNSGYLSGSSDNHPSKVLGAIYEGLRTKPLEREDILAVMRELDSSSLRDMIEEE